MDARRAPAIGPSARRPRFPIVILTASLLVLSLAALWTFWPARGSHGHASRREQRESSWPESPWKNARPDVKYVGAAACARCHTDIAATFAQHPMGRSLTPIRAAPAVGLGGRDGATSFQAGRSRLTVERRAGREVHREAMVDEQGNVLAQIEAEVAFALGSGSRGISYLVEHDGRLFESPISWYSQKGTWELSPGYEVHNVHFDRPIEPQCLFCHSDGARPVELSVNKYETPIFQGHAIGCERCHGPGELHARGQKVVDGRDLTIVNPRHLGPSLRGAVCEQCHIVGDQTVDRLGHQPFDYRPGLPSIAFQAMYAVVNEVGRKAVGHVEQMKLSRCFRESQGRLGCTSCHDPHMAPSPEQRITYFRDRCLECHESASCKLDDAARRAQSREDSCIQCHMPKAKTIDVVHVAATDHRVVRMPATLADETPSSGGRSPLVLLNGDDLRREDRAGLGRELAIAIALQGPSLPDTPGTREMVPVVLSLLETALARHPDDLLASRMKAQTLALSGRRREALPLIEAVLKAAPSYEAALDQYLAYSIDEGVTHDALKPARRRSRPQSVVVGLP